MTTEDLPWVRAPLRIRRAALEAIRVHAEETFPSECCGFVHGPRSDGALLDEAVRQVNEADKYTLGIP